MNADEILEARFALKDGPTDYIFQQLSLLWQIREAVAWVKLERDGDNKYAVK